MIDLRKQKYPPHVGIFVLLLLRRRRCCRRSYLDIDDVTRIFRRGIVGKAPDKKPADGDDDNEDDSDKAAVPAVCVVNNFSHSFFCIMRPFMCRIRRCRMCFITT